MRKHLESIDIENDSFEVYDLITKIVTSFNKAVDIHNEQHPEDPIFYKLQKNTIHVNASRTMVNIYFCDLSFIELPKKPYLFTDLFKKVLLDDYAINIITVHTRFIYED